MLDCDADNPPHSSDRRVRIKEAQQAAEELASADYSTPAESSQCDLVMKGGITSGVVYPLAACELARTYRFVNLGGSSAGAIAAVIVGAAEYNRDGGGFQRLAGVPAEIGTTLPTLFSPGPHTTTAHAALMQLLDKPTAALAAAEAEGDGADDAQASESTAPPKGSALHKVGIVLRVARRSRRREFRMALVLGLVVAAVFALVGSGLPTSVVDALQFAFLFVLGAVVAFVVANVKVLAGEGRDTVANLGDQGFGICVGSPSRLEKCERCQSGLRCERATNGDPCWVLRGAPDDGHGYMTDWIEAKVREVSGMDRPLTIGDLTSRDIHLTVMTTDLTHGVPRAFPFTDQPGEPPFMFDPEELGAYFPADVVDHLVANSSEATRNGHSLVSDCGNTLRFLPDAEHIPIVMAARISLSFPALISAIPLWTIDINRKEEADRQPMRCWFSDGGMTSNFPLRLFDSLWPRRPTFAIDLQPYHRDYPGQDAYYGGEKGRMTRVKRIANPAGFGAAILHTMQYWSDDQQALMPGFRDRIVELRQSPDEGGMNLTMDRRTVEILAAKGRTAARQIAPHPCRDSEGNEVSVGFDLEAHRTSRFSTAIGHLQMEVARLEGLYRPALPDGSPGYRSLMVSEPYASSMRRLAENVASSTGRPAPQWDPAAAVVTTDRLVDFATGGASDLSAFVDSPRGTVRVAPEV